MCTNPKCWRASVMLMQDSEASDGVATIKINAQNYRDSHGVAPYSTQ